MKQALNTMREQRLTAKAGLMDFTEEKQEDFEGLTKEGGGRENVAHGPR